MRLIRGLFVSAAVVLIVFSGMAGAGAQGNDAERQACAPDAMRLCADVIPDVPKVTACMKAKHAELSEPCRVVMDGGKPKHHGHYRHHRHAHCRSGNCG